MKAIATKLIDKFGRVVLPSTLREEMGIETGTEVQIFRGEGENEIVLKVVGIVDLTQYSPENSGDWINELFRE